MRFVTRCPACATTFKVVRDQLRISDGWVRCGRCGEVFDASTDLQAPSALASAPAPLTPPSPATQREKPPEDHIWPETEILDLEPALSMPKVSSPVVSRPVIWTTQAPVAPVLARQSEEAPVSTPSPIEQAVEAQMKKALRRERARAAAITKEREHDAQDVAPPPSPSPVPVPDADQVPLDTSPSGSWETETSLMGALTPRRVPLRHARWFVALSLLAALVLLVQVMRQERDLLVARVPALRPALQALCALSACEVAPLRQISAITFDGTSFSRQKDAPGYRLVFTLRNSQPMPLAMPAVELTLLDVLKRPIVRRVLVPEDYGVSPVLEARAQLVVSLPVELSGPEVASLPPVAGYNIDAFYP